MSKFNQILLIEKFLTSNEENLIINQVNEELGLFYLTVIKYFADKKTINLIFDINEEGIGIEDDLFGQKKIKIFNLTNSKKLAATLNLNSKKIIFTDYKNYKKLVSNYNCINGYKFDFDIMSFIKDELKIDNDELLQYCIKNPTLLFSETSKYLINNNEYAKDQSLVEEKNHILNIRKSIFEIKRSSLNIKNLYLSLKKEVDYKKFNFLTY